jgi:hypothetical protein
VLVGFFFRVVGGHWAGGEWCGTWKNFRRGGVGLVGGGGVGLEKSLESLLEEGRSKKNFSHRWRYGTCGRSAYLSSKGLRKFSDLSHRGFWIIFVKKAT